ncbi:MAG: GAF domain-containing protein [Anaerolineales bacterium]
MENNHHYSAFFKSVVVRKLHRSYPWILAGLVVLFFITFPVLGSPIWVAVPVAVTGWFYYRRGALIASILAVITDFLLLSLVFKTFSWSALFDLSDGFLVGHVFVIVLGLTFGYLREEIERFYEVDNQVHIRERHLVLVNMATRDILAMKDSADLYYHLLAHLINLFVADHGYLTSWDSTHQQVTLLAATQNGEQSNLGKVLEPEDAALALSVLESGHIVLIPDIQKSTFKVNPGPFREYRSASQSAMAIPLATKEYKFGVVILVFNTPSQFDREEISYFELTSTQITLALRNIFQENRIEKQLKEAQSLSAIEYALSETERGGTDKVLQLIVESACDLIQQADESVIHLVDEESGTLFPKATAGMEEERKSSDWSALGLKEGVAKHVLLTGKTVNIGDINSSDLYIRKGTPPTYSSLLVAPVQSGEHPIGTISVQSNEYNAFSESDAQLLNSLSIQAAIAIENTRLFEATQQSLKEINALYQTSRALAQSLDADQLIRDMIGALQQAFDYYYVQVYLIDAETQNLVLKHGSGHIGNKLMQENHYLLPGEGIVGHVAETGKPFVTNNVDDVVFFKRNPLLPETTYEIAVPIKIDNEEIGVLDIQQIAPHRLSDHDLQLMTAIADQLAAVLQKANLYGNLQKALQQEQMVRSQLIQSERLALVGRLLASVSHELNNPLQAIQNALFLLKEEKNLSTQAKQDLDVILSEAERMAALIERLRSAYRPIRMKDFQSVDLNNLIEDVHTLISTHMRHKKIVFEFFPDPELLQVLGLPDQLRQVVLNLFLNAIEIMQPGGRLTVWTRNLSPKNEVLLTVKDTGPGIDDEILPQIFDAFITSKHTGTGLGLTITHDIIQQHHGRITAGNDPEGGAVFNVWLPVDERGNS